MVKELRDKTGAGMMDCKAALSESGGDLEAAVDWLRKKGLSKAAKKAGRVAAEGLIGVARHGQQGRRGRGQFRNRFRGAQRSVPGPGEDDRAMSRSTPAPTSTRSSPRRSAASTVADAIAETIAKIGENMTLRRAAALSVGKGVVASYVHNSVADGLGRIGVIVALELAGNADELKALRPHGGDARRFGQSAGGRSVRARCGDHRAREERAGRQVQGAGQARQRDRQDRRVGAEDLLQGSLPARSGLHFRRQEERGPGAQGEPRRRPARRSRSPASCAMRSARASTGPSGDFGGEVAGLAGTH